MSHPQRRPFLTFTVESFFAGQTLHNVLRTHFGMSRTLLGRLRREGRCEVDGAVAGLNTVLRPGVNVALYLSGHRDGGVSPEPMPLRVIFEDDHLLVVEKPAGVLVHPSGPVLSGTLANGVAHYLRSRGESSAAGPVTRLDKDTSGLVLFAKHPHAHHRLMRAMQNGGLQRKYLAIVEGHLEASEGQIDAPIARIPGQLTRRCVSAGGQPATTRFQVIGRWQGLPEIEHATLVEVTLLTGRTHQIRVHFAHIGHPIVGDVLYGRAIPGLCERQALHAHWLHVHHPISGRPYTWVSSLPNDMQPLLHFASSGSAGRGRGLRAPS